MTEASAPSGLDRKFIGVRVGYVLLAVACYFATAWILATWGTIIPTKETAEVMGQVSIQVLDQDQMWSVLQWLIVTIGVAVGCDTARPSGSRQSTFQIGPAPVGPAPDRANNG